RQSRRFHSFEPLPRVQFSFAGRLRPSSQPPQVKSRGAADADIVVYIIPIVNWICRVLPFCQLTKESGSIIDVFASPRSFLRLRSKEEPSQALVGGILYFQKDEAHPVKCASSEEVCGASVQRAWGAGPRTAFIRLAVPPVSCFPTH